MYTRVIVRRTKNWSTYESRSAFAGETNMHRKLFSTCYSGQRLVENATHGFQSRRHAGGGAKKNPNVFTRSP